MKFTTICWATVLATIATSANAFSFVPSIHSVETARSCQPVTALRMVANDIMNDSDTAAGTRRKRTKKVRDQY